MAEEAKAIAELAVASVTQTQIIARLLAENQQLKEAVARLYATSGRGLQRRTLARRGN